MEEDGVEMVNSPPDFGRHARDSTDDETYPQIGENGLPMPELTRPPRANRPPMDLNNRRDPNRVLYLTTERIRDPSMRPRAEDLEQQADVETEQRGGVRR